ncbi:MAG: TetR/AcrR family transcriptional regulator [Gammaproteobacteria bacterium]|nr:TetR/AcrR family transcriptional regulator [Gammaproteobacteria bacterium]
MSIEQKVHGRKIKQQRGQVTYQALVDTGFRLLEKKDLENISVAELAKEAGYSVGAFYARFHSKDQFFDALIQAHLISRTNTLVELYTNISSEALVEDLIENMINYYWEHRQFWRTVLLKSSKDADFWEPFKEHFFASSKRFIGWLYLENNRTLSEQEEANIYFAFQVVQSTINNTLFNRSGPVLIGQKLFVEELVRTFRLVSDFDNLVKKS